MRVQCKGGIINIPEDKIGLPHMVEHLQDRLLDRPLAHIHVSTMSLFDEKVE